MGYIQVYVNALQLRSFLKPRYINNNNNNNVAQVAFQHGNDYNKFAVLYDRFSLLDSTK